MHLNVFYSDTNNTKDHSYDNNRIINKSSNSVEQRMKKIEIYDIMKM